MYEKLISQQPIFDLTNQLNLVIKETMLADRKGIIVEKGQYKNIDYTKAAGKLQKNKQLREVGIDNWQLRTKSNPFMFFADNQLIVYVQFIIQLYLFKMLDAQRLQSSFNTRRLAQIIYGGADKLKYFIDMQLKIANDPIMKFKPSLLQSQRKQIILHFSKVLLRYHQLFGDKQEARQYKRLFFAEQIPLLAHSSMFQDVLATTCTQDQLKLFYLPSLRGKIFGCYAQTELAHGSDVQSLMTTATYDPQTEEFVLNTPCIEAIKWWIGDLGIFANHAAVIAQLIINGQKYGTHTFIVNIRDMYTHQVLPNVEVGDIGPKYGFAGKDSGYLKFNNLRIPRNNMLMRYAKVSKEGQYSRSGDEKIGYATLLLTRGNVPKYSFLALIQATTIATRYSIVRSQFRNQEGEEISILDYQLQQDKILPYIAEAYALSFGYKQLAKVASGVVEVDVMKHNNFSRLNQIHALSSGLKAIWTSDTMKALEILRRSAGGHGFHMYSGLPGLLQQTAPGPTFEGENTILLLQVARFLLKSLEAVEKQQQVGLTIRYIGDLYKSRQTHLVKVLSDCGLQVLEDIFRKYAYASIVRAKSTLKEGQANGLTYKESWDFYAGISLINAALAHSYYWSYSNMKRKINQVQDVAVRQVLTKVTSLYGISKIREHSEKIYANGVVDSQGLKMVDQIKESLLKQLRRQALGLVEAFSLHDNTLKTAIGQSNGRPYQTLLKWAREENVVNKPEVKNELYQMLKENRTKIKLGSSYQSKL